MCTIPKKINPDIEIERRNCSFDSNEFAEWIWGSKEMLAEKRFVEETFLNDPELQDKVPTSYLSHKEIYEEALKKGVLVLQKLRKLEDEGKIGYIMGLYVMAGMTANAINKLGAPMALHTNMFLPAILGHGTIAQQERWYERARNFNILGTYAQTELGHGTFVRGLETTATYDLKTKEFVLHSPSITAYKWWPGGMGQTANHAVVLAQLYTHGKCHGIQPFMVQIRDEETHMPMPGIKIGEIGNKLGLNGWNNGFLGFDNVRIPLDHMLMKNAKVLEDGTFLKPPSRAMTYSTMTFVRVVITRDCSDYIAKAATIATRYSTIRKQSPINPDDPEPKIIEHITQQYKIFPSIAKALVFRLSSEYLWDMYNQVTSELSSGNLERIPELHALSCCLKAVVTSEGAKAVEICRLACGGHGFMQSSGFPSTYAHLTAACTYEGENTVMLLQTARYLLKAWSQALAGEKLVPTVAYFEKAVKYGNSRQNWNNSVDGIINALETIAAGKICLASEKILKRIKSGNTREEAVNLVSIELVDAVNAHCRAFILKSGHTIVEKAQVSPQLHKSLRHLIELYAVDLCLQNIGDLLRFVNVGNEDIDALHERLDAVLVNIRPNAVGLVDGFDIHDKVVASTLGSYDGNVYERLYDEALKSPLNQEPVNKTFHTHLKPFMRSRL